MAIKTKVMVAGEWVKGEELEFKAPAEDWRDYELEDGTRLKFKTIITKIIRTEKKHPVRNDPIYVVSSHSVVEAVVPESQKTKA